MTTVRRPTYLVEYRDTDIPVTTRSLEEVADLVELFPRRIFRVSKRFPDQQRFTDIFKERWFPERMSPEERSTFLGS